MRTRVCAVACFFSSGKMWTISLLALLLLLLPSIRLLVSSSPSHSRDAQIKKKGKKCDSAEDMNVIQVMQTIAGAKTKELIFT